MRSQLTVALLLLAAAVWTSAIAVSSEFEESSILLIGVGLILTASVATVGILVTRGRWAHRLALSGLAMTLVTALLLPLDGFWFAGLGITAAAAATMFSPRLEIRRLPSATGPPTKAVVTPLLLVAAPFAYGLVGGLSPTWALLTVGLSAPVVAFGYAAVKPGGLFGVRVLWPAAAIGLSPLLETSAAWTSASIGLAVAFLAWDKTVKTAFHPPRERGTAYPIPPELSPDAVREAAEIDEHGRRP